MDESVTVKGTPARSLQRFIESELTPEQRDALFRNLPPELAARFRTPILATETLPVRLLNRFTEEAARARGEQLEDFARRAGRAGASEAVKGVVRFFAMVLTPAALLGRASQMWRSLYSRGELRVDEQTANTARVRLLDFPSEIAGCSRVTGWIERMAELTGVKDIRVDQTECFARGGTCCEWRIRWR